MTACPKCGSAALHHSEMRTWERPRSLFTRTRPRRCTDCRWRGWMMTGEAEPATTWLPIEPIHAGELDLGAIDRALLHVPVLGRSSR
jgi:hypothetical protein